MASEPFGRLFFVSQVTFAKIPSAAWDRAREEVVAEASLLPLHVRNLIAYFLGNPSGHHGQYHKYGIAPTLCAASGICWSAHPHRFNEHSCRQSSSASSSATPLHPVWMSPLHREGSKSPDDPAGHINVTPPPGGEWRHACGGGCAAHRWIKWKPSTAEWSRRGC